MKKEDRQNEAAREWYRIQTKNKVLYFGHITRIGIYTTSTQPQQGKLYNLKAGAEAAFARLVFSNKEELCEVYKLSALVRCPTVLCNGCGHKGQAGRDAVGEKRCLSCGRPL